MVTPMSVVVGVTGAIQARLTESITTRCRRLVGRSYGMAKDDDARSARKEPKIDPEREQELVGKRSGGDEHRRCRNEPLRRLDAGDLAALGDDSGGLERRSWMVAPRLTAACANPNAVALESAKSGGWLVRGYGDVIGRDEWLDEGDLVPGDDHRVTAELALHGDVLAQRFLVAWRDQSQESDRLQTGIASAHLLGPAAKDAHRLASASCVSWGLV